jgi:hypothetical protein
MFLRLWKDENHLKISQPHPLMKIPITERSILMDNVCSLLFHACQIFPIMFTDLSKVKVEMTQQESSYNVTNSSYEYFVLIVFFLYLSLPRSISRKPKKISSIF